ncbi:MAG: cache domain-containing protein [Lachnospiraceae bacterium]|nr:cache domain-containing protein [Lachnospiraceae bacterium]
MKKGNVSIKIKLLALSLVPLLIVGIVACVASATMIRRGMEDEILEALDNVSKFYRDSRLNMQETLGDQMEVEYPENTYEDELKRDVGYDFTWFEGDTRAKTSVVTSDGKRPIGTQAASEVISEVIGKGNSFQDDDTMVAGTPYYVAYQPVKSGGQVVGMAFVGKPKASVDEHINKSVMVIVLIIVVIVLIAAVVAFLNANKITRVVLELEAAISALSEGRFEKATEFLDRNDELGDMIRNMNDLIDELDKLLLGIKKSADDVDSHAMEVENMSEKIFGNAEGATNSIGEIASGATQQAEDIQSATENVGSISEAIQRVLDSAESLEETAKNMHENSKASAEQLSELSKASDGMSDNVHQISQSIGATSDAVERINAKVSSITEIASQTNLLSLNASIEAARAGEAGRGFAVVAEEIGKLAVDSAKAAEEISAEMNVLLNESQGAVKKSEDVMRATDEQKKVLESTVATINSLIEDIKITVAGVESISNDARGCDTAKVVVVDAMSGLSAISQQNAAASQETANSMHELNDNMQILERSAEIMKGIADDMEEKLTFFKFTEDELKG